MHLLRTSSPVLASPACLENAKYLACSAVHTRLPSPQSVPVMDHPGLPIRSRMTVWHLGDACLLDTL
jgi:hypothetical protein